MNKVSVCASVSVMLAAACGAAAQDAISASSPRASSSLVSSDFDLPESTTCGIQEAIDALPEAGGTVLVPIGDHVVDSTIVLRDRVVLEGQGRGSVISKSSAFRVLLAEPVKKGDDHVVVKDASLLKVGMYVLIVDRSNEGGEGWINKIEGNTVFLDGAYRAGRWGRPWTSKSDLSPQKEACVCNGFFLLRTRADCVIRNLSFDGNKDGQVVDGQEMYRDYPLWHQRLRCTPYIGGNSRLENCWVYDAAGVCVSLGGPATVRGCEIWGSYQGIHPGAGPYAKIEGNTIHHHEDVGIALCLGNFGLIIRGNHIYDNGRAGIGALGIVTRRPGRCGDFFTVISDNVIFRNGEAGIMSGQGDMGPQDFVITGNIVKDNWQAGRPPRLGLHGIPAGIALGNPRGCVIAANRCFDDQDAYAAVLAEDIEPGATRLPYLPDPQWGYTKPLERWWIDYEEYRDFDVRLTDGTRVERVHVSRGRGLSNKAYFELDTPVTLPFPKGSDIRAEKTQVWGIFAGGPEAADNVIANNLCNGNSVGGVLWGGGGVSLSANLGAVREMASDASLADSVYPLPDQVMITNGGFESEVGWKLPSGASLDNEAHSGRRALKLVREGDGPPVVDAVSDVLSLKPNTRYRLTAWVKTEAMHGEQPVLPYLLMVSRFKGGGNTVVASYSQPLTGADFERVPTETNQWIRVGTEMLTGNEPMPVVIYCRLTKGVGKAWIDDIEMRAGNDAVVDAMRLHGREKPVVRAPLVPVPPRIDGADRDPAWAAADKAGGFIVRGTAGKPERGTTVMICRDEQNLYVHVSCADPETPGRRARLQEEKPFSFARDGVALLLRPVIHDEVFHYQLAIASNGATYTQICTHAGNDSKTFDIGWHTATRVENDRWSAELAIPFLELCGMPPDPGTVWGINFGRIAAGIGGPGGCTELSSWAATDDWHDVTDYGRLVL